MKKLLILLILPFYSMTTDPVEIVTGKKISGIASYYHDKFSGRKTASGEVYLQTKLTAASNHFKLGTIVRVTNLTNGKQVIVKINDRMGHKGRIIDLTKRAATDLGMLKAGLAKVEVQELITTVEKELKYEIRDSLQSIADSDAEVQQSIKTIL
jgi:rare lipoprotein A